MANVELYKVRIEDENGTKAFYPHTSTDVVFDKTGKSVDELLGKKSDTTHTHDDRYYTENEMNTKLSAKLDTTGNASNVTNTFTQATSRANLTTGEKLAVSLGKIMKWFADLKTVAFSGSYADLTNKPTALKNPTAMKVQLNSGTTEGTNQFTYDGSTAKNVNITPSGIGAAASNHNHDTSYSKILDGAGNLLTNVPMMIPRQHIINPDFQINQRGQTTYYANGTSWLYTVDMWRINNHSKLYVNDGYIRFHKVDSDQQALLNQVVKTEGKSITVIKVKEINGTATVRFGDSTVTKTITQSGIFTIENDTPISSVAIDLVTNGHYIDIKYIDLWEGDIAYPHVKNKYKYDLMECEEKMFPLAIGSYIPIGSCIFYDGYLTIFIGKRFKDSPSVIYNGIFTVYAIENEQNLESKTITDAFYDKRVGCLRLKLSGVSFANGKTMLLQTGEDSSTYLILTNEPL